MEDSNDPIELQERRYYWYALGCEHLGWMPLLPADFGVQYARLQKCERIVSAYRKKSGDNEFWQSQGFSESLRLGDMLDNIKQEINRLCGLDRAVLTGKRLDEDGGASVGARLQPMPPILTGTAAKQLPYGDTESDVRNPWPA